MESDTPTSSSDNKGFVSKVFSIDADSKAGLMNGIQYIVLAIVPIAVVDSMMKNDNFQRSLRPQILSDR